MCSSWMRWWGAVELIEKILKEGGKRVDELEVFHFSGSTVTGRLKRRMVHYASGSEQCGLFLRVIKGGRIGTSATTNPGKWEPCLDAAIASAGLATAQEWGGLPGPGNLDFTPLNYDPSVEPDAGAAKMLLQDLMEGCGAYPVEITSGSAEISRFTAVLANTHGLSCRNMESLVSVGIETIVEQSTGYEFESSWTREVEPGKVGEKAAYLAYTSRGGRDIASGAYDVVLSPVALAQLMGGVFLPALNGKNVHAGRSRLAPLLEQQVMDKNLSLIDEPLHPRGPGSCRWDGEGTPTRRLAFVDGGILRAFAYDLKTAYRYGRETTGSAVRGGHGGAPSIGVHTLTLEGKRCSLLDDRVVYVHDVVGAHTANPLTGDFSVELSNAYLMRDGTIEYPVKKAMISGNVFEMLRETGGLSHEEKVMGSMVLPEIRLKNMAIIGN